VLTANRNQQWKHRHRKNYVAPFASTRSRASRWYLFCAYSRGRITRTSITCASVSCRSDGNYVNNNAYVPIKATNIRSLCLFLSIGRVTSVELSVPYLLVYHIILVMFLWSYFKTIFTEPSGAPPNVLTDNLSLLIVTCFIGFLTHSTYLFYYSSDCQKKYLKSSIGIL